MSQAIKIGIFTTICLLVLAYFILRVEELRLFAPEAQRVDAVFDSVAGLDDKATVRVAGVRVGRVDGVRLEGRKARVSLLLETPVRLTSGARARIANLGLLGDKYIELEPGPPDAPELPEGAVLPGEAPVSVDQAMEKLTSIGESIERVTVSLAGEGEETSLSRLIDNLEAVSDDIRALVAANREEVSATVANFRELSAALARDLPRVAERVDGLLAEVRAVVGENRADLRGSMENVRELTESLQVSVDNLNEISGKVARGEGSLGKLVQSEEAHDELVAALESVQSGIVTLSSAFGRIEKYRLDLGFQGYYLEDAEDSRTAFSLQLDPESDRFYLVELVDDPRGRVRTKTDVVTVTEPDGTSETTTIERVTTEDKLTVSAQFGFRFGDARLRAGIFESTGGAAVDYALLDRRLWLSLEAFDFGREEDLDPRVRFTTRWHLHPNLFLLGGYDDLLVSDRDSAFFGAGVRWSDDDLKYLLGAVPLRF